MMIKLIITFLVLIHYDSVTANESLKKSPDILLNDDQKCSPINATFKVPKNLLIIFNRSIDNDLVFFKDQSKQCNRMKQDLKAAIANHFRENLKIRSDRRQNLTRFRFNKRKLCFRLSNSTFNRSYKSYLADLQTVFNQFEFLEHNLEHLIRLNERAKEKINIEISKVENYFDDGFGVLPIEHKLKDYSKAIAKEIDFTKERIRFHFFNFFFLGKVLLIKERWIADHQSNKLIQSVHQLGPFHKFAFSGKRYQIRIVELISKKQFLEKI